jgi:hypothetical protein
LSNWMTYGLSSMTGSFAWRFPIAFQLVFSLILLATVPWLPESPRWLLAHGHEKEGEDVLIALAGGNTNVANQKREILEAAQLEKDNAPSWSDILHGRTNGTGMIKRLALGAGRIF